MINRERLIKRFMEYVQVDSETRSEGRFAQLMTAEMTRLGMSVAEDRAGEPVGSDGNNLVGRLQGTLPGEPILFSAHMDTVMPGKGIRPRLDGEVLRSAGDTILGADDKGGIAAILEAVETLRESGRPHRTIEVLLTIAEEGGLNGAKHMDLSLVQGRYGYVLDSGGAPGQIVVKAPSQDKIEARILGQPAHAGICPEEGISAIQVAARAIQDMRLLRIDEETTANIGIIRGGEATNIVCPEVWIKAEARSLTAEKLEQQTRHMVQCIEEACAAYGAHAEIRTLREYDGYRVGDEEPLLAFTERVMTGMGLKPVRAASGGGSDTNIFNNRGLRLLNLGTGMSKAHTLDEFIRVSDLEALGALVLGLIDAWDLE